VIEPLLLTTVRICTCDDGRPLTGASGFFFARDGRLFLVTSRHVVIDTPSGHVPSRLETDCDGHPKNVLTRDELLDNIMLYWCTASAASSARLYWESFRSLSRFDIDLPTGVSIYPKEIFRASRRWAERHYRNLIHWNELDRGGHFAALERPQVFVDEVRTCFRSQR
jgi:pimeloyl-ACP methyl ester carboxylesterase